MLVYLILVAQFRSFIDPFLIVLAVPTGIVGVILTLVLTGTTLNIQSLMGIVMLQGMVVSNSILIVDFANVLRGEGRSVTEAAAHACRIRLRPILDDFAGDGGRPVADGFQTGNRQRGLCSSGSRDYRRPAHFDRADDVCRPRRLSAHLPAAGGIASDHRCYCGVNTMKTPFRMTLLLAVLALMPRSAAAQNIQPQGPEQGQPQNPPQGQGQPPAQPQSLTLTDAEKIALANHPQIQTAQNLASAAKQQTREVRSSYYPQANGSLTGAEAIPDSRIAAGGLNNPIILGPLLERRPGGSAD